MFKESNEKWDLVIEPQQNLFDLKLNKLWHYRDLLWLFVRRDFVAFYKQTILGPIWFFLQPVFTMLIYTYVFGDLAGISTDNIPAPLFYLVGITSWTYFSDCVTKTATVFRDNASIFGKVYFPRLIMPMSIVISNLVRFGVQLLLFSIVYLYFSVKFQTIYFNEYLLLFPLLLALMALQGFGFGLIITALTTKYRDLALLVTFGMQLLMYGTTVIYPLSSVNGMMKTIVSLNPMTPIIEGLRLGILGKGTFDTYSLLYTSIFTIFITILGVLFFNKVDKNFIDTI